MGKIKQITISLASLTALMIQGCQQRSGVWDESNTATHMNDGTVSLWGSDSLTDDPDGVFGIGDSDFIALNEEDLRSQFAEAVVAQSNITPGEEGGAIPGIQHFKNPTDILATIFRTVYFNTNAHDLKAEDSKQSLARVASYLKEHPNLYIFISGHCDERGPEAYNMALGTRRANYVRSFLVRSGVNPDNIFTISYGKEKPMDLGHNYKAWAINRRAEFKIYEK